MDLLEEGKPIEGGAMDALLGRIVEEYAPETETFPITILLEGKPETFPFRRLTDGVEWDKLQKEAADYALSFRPKKVGKAKMPKPMAPEMRKWSEGVKPEVFAQVYVITRLAMHPAFKSEAGMMMMYRKVWPVFKSITGQIDLAMTNQIGDAELADYVKEGEGSGPTLPTGPA